MIGTSRSIGPIVRYQSCTPGADAEGDIDAMSLWAGQSVGSCRSRSLPLISCAKMRNKLIQFSGDAVKSLF